MTLFDACDAGDIDAVRILLDGDKKLAAAKDDGCNRPLHRAAAAGQADVIRVLVTRDAKLDVKNKKGQTALLVAIIEGKADAAHALAALGADGTIVGRGMPVLHESLWLGHYATAELASRPVPTSAGSPRATARRRRRCTTPPIRSTYGTKP